LGDSTKARDKLNWIPKISFQSLVKEMVQEDLKLAKKDAMCLKEGFKVFEYQE
jgi:GDPmannose 4,6-dehydratase